MLATRPQAAVQFRLFPRDHALIEQYAEKVGKPTASAIRTLVLQQIANELRVEIDLTAYDNSTSLHAQVARDAGMTLGQLQAVSLHAMTQAIKSGAVDLPTLLRNSGIEPAAAPTVTPRVTLPRRRPAKR